MNSSVVGKLRLRSASLAAALAISAALPVVAAAAQPAAAPPAAEQAPERVRELLKLLGDPQVQAWLERQRDHQTLTASPSSGALSSSLAQYFGGRAEAAHEHMAALAAAVPGLAGEFAHAWALFRADLAGFGIPKILLLLALFVGLGAGVEWLLYLATRGFRRYLEARPVGVPGDRLVIVGGRLALAAGRVAAFAVGSIGAFLAFEWPPLLGEILMGYLTAVLVTRIVLVLGQFLLAPEEERFRITPMGTLAARFWQRRLGLAVGWFAIGFVTVQLLAGLDFSLPGRQLTAYALGIGLLAVGLEAVWRRPFLGGGPPAVATGHRAFENSGRNAGFSVAMVTLWLLWVVRAMPAFWLAAVTIVVPLACGVAGRSVENLLRPVDPAETKAVSPSVMTVLLERGLRAGLIIAGIAVLAWGWGVDLEFLTQQDTLPAHLMRGVLAGVIIALVADVIWHMAKAAIDRAMPGTSELGQPNTPEARRRARLRTLLPIFRNVLLVTVVSVAAMMVLAALGVEIGPLIAGAGVVGVAIGFGAQAFVRDVIAGMFYLIDDAFRVGEYIQSGNYKGTVESFSIRSVRLRHHRGPVYTVPFSLLGAVQNMSRDWVIDKLTIGITYDSDIERARKLVKQIGQELAAIPEFAPLIIEPLKMQGVEKFDDFAVQIRLKMMTIPGEQFVIRRKAYAMIKKAFDANGIKFAFPTVQVADGDRERAAAAETALELVEAPKVA